MNINLRFILALILLAGTCGYNATHAARPKSKSTKTTVDANALLENARTAFREYQFDKAIEYLDSYKDAVAKSKSSVSTSYDSLYRAADLGSTMLGRVESITIIDSITVDKNAFLDAYRLSAPTGRISSAQILPSDFPSADPTAVYITEDGNRMIWAAPAMSGKYTQLVQSSRLTDGTWESPSSLPGLIPTDRNSNFPFLLSDGTTLYFASDGDESLGGLDIFISRDNGTGFLQPQNIGMPYNSPYDDYMLAIDDITGIGWWATDRNRIPDKVTIYLFIPQEMRVSYPADREDIASLAFITDIKATQTDPQLVANRLAILNSAETDAADQADEFQISLPNGKVLTSSSQVTSSRSQALLQQYLDTSREFDNTCARLTQLRSDYANGHLDTAAEILRLERRIDSDRTRVQSALNQFIKSLNSSL